MKEITHRCSVTRIENGTYTRSFPKKGNSYLTPQFFERFEREFTSLAVFKFDHVQSFTMMKDNESALTVSRPYITGKSLFDVIESKSLLNWLNSLKSGINGCRGAIKVTSSDARSQREMNEKEKLFFALTIIDQIAAAIELFHDKNISLKNLGPRNIIINDKLEVTVVDVGIEAIMLEHLAGMSLSPNDLLLIGPEGSNDKHRSSKELDIWNLGIILYYILAGKMPFVENNLVVMMQNFANGNIYFDCDSIQNESVILLLHMMLKAEPSKRPDIFYVSKEIKRIIATLKKESSRLSDNPLRSSSNIVHLNFDNNAALSHIVRKNNTSNLARMSRHNSHNNKMMISSASLMKSNLVKVKLS
ncbi:hypothetical protein TRFO_40449 [Tritrichomonas foetus]|uniref:Protein kinase domain-containing protein n=1 Tax=Tritrichomonas foetus TaxID=1144522 RepID=A0A1J4J6E9_9EUKA|nr:hypothetical protein TRFO_40449 [Tritrichomonas foetus]|eukprot:OHS93243.1 hypothetical protein TRFO_40449 [Tritrichomonas foetus]